ncbi:hypothetical protein MJO29_001876 [Puccinia striiformis f. sp. tritici]|nr:hypothetical protein MJO29_001876 [Puccinia striiformis f. sp. tritici]
MIFVFKIIISILQNYNQFETEKTALATVFLSKSKKSQPEKQQDSLAYHQKNEESVGDSQQLK